MRNSPFNNCFIIPYHLLTGVNSWFPSYLQSFPPYRCICCWHACYQSIKSLVPNLLYKIWEMENLSLVSNYCCSIHHYLYNHSHNYLLLCWALAPNCLSLHNYGLQNYSNQHKFFASLVFILVSPNLLLDVSLLGL